MTRISPASAGDFVCLRKESVVTVYLDEYVRSEDEEQIIEALCEICTRVGEYHKNQYAADCFCRNSALAKEAGWTFQFEQHILQWINLAVEEKMLRDGEPESRWIGIEEEDDDE